METERRKENKMMAEGGNRDAQRREDQDRQRHQEKEREEQRQREENK